NLSLETRLIDDLMDHARIKSGKLRLDRENTNAHDLLKHVVEICADDLRTAHLTLALDLGAKRHYVSADPVRLSQVLWNLLKNAIKFTPADGTVTVRSRDADARGGCGSRSRLVLEISDTGIGMEPDEVSRFDANSEQIGPTAANPQAGLGLGLVISRAI